ncbi:hypothetical protein GCM10023080_026800 [Streptomyces pseudoechinosporeus]
MRDRALASDALGAQGCAVRCCGNVPEREGSGMGPYDVNDPCPKALPSGPGVDDAALVGTREWPRGTGCLRRQRFRPEAPEK